jgi:hypothetical protein
LWINSYGCRDSPSEVRIAAIVYLVHASVHEEWELPAWLVEQKCTHAPGAFQRSPLATESRRKRRWHYISERKWPPTSHRQIHFSPACSPGETGRRSFNDCRKTSKCMRSQQLCERIPGMPDLRWSARMRMSNTHAKVTPGTTSAPKDFQANHCLRKQTAEDKP